MTQDTTYNGWTNYDTWLCNLHYDCFFEEQAQEYYAAAQADDTFTKEERAALDLEDYIKETVDEFAQEALGQKPNPFIQDIVNGCLRDINYYEIAKGYIESVDKENAA